MSEREFVDQKKMCQNECLRWWIETRTIDTEIVSFHIKKLSSQYLVFWKCSISSGSRKEQKVGSK
jgi:hypothetical protein